MDLLWCFYVTLIPKRTLEKSLNHLLVPTVEYMFNFKGIKNSISCSETYIQDVWWRVKSMEVSLPTYILSLSCIIFICYILISLIAIHFSDLLFCILPHFYRSILFQTFYFISPSLSFEFLLLFFLLSKKEFFHGDVTKAYI